MNQEKIGLFIRTKRIEKGLTQEQLAANLEVSSKTVSRWERGLNIPDSTILQSLSIELGVTTSELMIGEVINEEMDSEEYTKLGIDYSLKEFNQNVNKFKRRILITLIFTLILLMDVSYGYFSASLSWQINEKMIFPRGIIYSLIFSQEIVNYEGIILTNMFYLFILILLINILLILAYVFLTLSQTKKR